MIPAYSAREAAAAVIALVLAARRWRKEEEQRQFQQAQAQADAENEARAARKAALWEQLKVQNWLRGKAMLEEQLEHLRKQGASEEQIAALRKQGARAGLGMALVGTAALFKDLKERGMDKAFRTWYKIEREFQGKETPDEAIRIPPLTADQYVAFTNWNTAAQVAAFGATTVIATALGMLTGILIGGPSGFFVGSVLGAVVGVMWGAYEVSCIQSAQEQFTYAYEHKVGVEVWREGRMTLAVHAEEADTVTLMNSPFAYAYMYMTTWIMTGQTP